jgi:hypothetical protein
MKRTKWMLAAAVVAIGLGMASCTDNIDNGTTPSEKELQEQEAKQAKAQKFWAVVSHLVDVDDYTVDYEDKTFEPTYGVTQGTDATTRYVYTNTLAAAAERFGDLVGRSNVNELTQSYTYDDPDVGTLVYTKGTGRILATVEVNIKQIPNLKQIIYVPGAYANGSFSGRAYYRFGDVVKREVPGYPNGTVTEYWICVRPSFGPEGKGDSHWVCLNVLPYKNVWHKKASNKHEYWLPTGLGTNEEQMQNLAEMLYAIYFPDEWKRNNEFCYDHDVKLKMFHDFSLERDSLHNQYFWKNVQEKWSEKRILQNALNFDGSKDDFRRMLGEHYLRLLYNGYSWMTTFSWNCTLYEANFSCEPPVDDDDEAHPYVLDDEEYVGLNMHQVFYREVTMNMKEMPDVDCRKMGKGNGSEDYYNKYGAYFKEIGSGVADIVSNYRWTVRHALGKELSTDGTYSVKRKINGVTDVYRYYKDVEPDAKLNLPPEVTLGDDEGYDDEEE